MINERAVSEVVRAEMSAQQRKIAYNGRNEGLSRPCSLSRDAPSTPTPGAKQYFKKSASRWLHIHLPTDKKIIIPKIKMTGYFMLDIFFYEIISFV